MMKADSRPVLVPMVAGSRGGCAPPSSAHAEMRRGHLPYIPLASPPDLDCGGAFCFGRAEILTSTFAACGCLPSLCCHCEEANGWGVRFLSRRMLRLLPDRDNEEERGDRVSFRAQIRGENASRTVLVDGRPILGRRKRGGGGTGDWIGGCLVRPGSVVSFAHPEHQGRGQGGGRDGRILSFQMHVQAGAGRSGSAEPKFVPSYTRSGAASALPHSVVDLCPSNEPNMSPSSSAPHSVVDLCSSSSPPHPSVSPSAPPSRRLSCVVYLLERGRGMPRSRVDLLRRTLTEKEGVSVADSFTSSARFVVIDDNVTAQDYPDLLVTAGLNDPRVQYWESAKWTAKLRVTKTGDSQLLLKTNMAAGHSGKSGRYGAIEDVAYVYAWLLDGWGLAETAD